MKLNHPAFRTERKPKSTLDHCPMSPSGEHAWSAEHLPDPNSFGAVVPTGSDICTLCGLTQ